MTDDEEYRKQFKEIVDEAGKLTVSAVSTLALFKGVDETIMILPDNLKHMVWGMTELVRRFQAGDRLPDNMTPEAVQQLITWTATVQASARKSRDFLTTIMMGCSNLKDELVKRQ